MAVTRIYADTDGESHFADMAIPLADRGALGYMSEQLSVGGVIFRANAPDYDLDWHTAPRRQYSVRRIGDSSGLARPLIRAGWESRPRENRGQTPILLQAEGERRLGE